MKRLLFFIPSFEGGGAERVASTLLNYWNKNSLYDIKILNTLDRESDFFNIDSSIPRKTLKFSYSENSIVSYLIERKNRLFLLREELKEYEGDTVVSFLTTPSILILIASIGLNKKIICCEHNNYYAYGNKLTRLSRNILYYLLAHKVTLLTERDLYNYPSFLRSKIEILPNPLGVDGFELNIDSNINKDYEGPLRLLFVGRLTEQKGIERLSAILKGIQDLEWNLNICGDGELRPFLEQFIKATNLNNKVHLEGAVKNIHEYYQDADILIMTSLWEGLPMVIAEAMSFGVPVIAFDCPTGPREYINHNSNGFLISDGDIKAYVSQLKELIQSPNIVRSMSDITRRSVEAYKIHHINDKWSNMID